MTARELPTFEAHWWPVHLETVPGSGEALTIAVIVRSAAGQATVRQAIPPSSLLSLFGAAGKGMVLIAGSTVLDIKGQLDAMVPVEQLDMPFGGLRLGRPRDCVAHDVNEVFDIAMRLSTAFSLSLFGVAESKPARDAQRAFDEWAGKVRADVMNAELADRLMNAFNQPIPLQGKKKLRVGFAWGSYVAQFGVLRPGASLHADQRALKLKLFDLESLRREKPLQFERAELLVGMDKLGDSYPQRQREALAATWDFITHEAVVRDVKPLRYSTAHEAGEHIRRQAA